MDSLIFDLVQALVSGLTLFLLASGLTLIFSMMGILNFAHASFYMLGAYISYILATKLGALNPQIFGLEISGYWLGLLIAPIIVGFIGAMVQRYLMERVIKYGQVAPLIFTFSLSIFIGDAIRFLRLPTSQPYYTYVPEGLSGKILTIDNADIPTYKIFMICVAVLIFIALLLFLYRTRVGMIIQAATTHPHVAGMLGHNVPYIFMMVFGIGTMLAAIAGAIAGPLLGINPGMASSFGPLVFVVVIIGGLGSLTGAFIAAIFIGIVRTFSASSSSSIKDLVEWTGVTITENWPFDWFWAVQFTQLSEVLPYLFMILILILRPQGLMGIRE